MIVVFYTSGHGFGHASRDLEVIRELKRIDPASKLIVRTAVPEWFFRESRVGAAEIQPLEADVGAVQIDSLQIDTAETASRASRFHAGFAARAESEASLLQHLDADVVVGDVPPLAFAAARLANIPSVLLANFTWDWIYGGFADFERLAPGVIEQITAAYAAADVALRLPFHGGFAPVASVTWDIPLIARASAFGKSESRRRLDISDEQVLVLASFGRYGVRLPYDTVLRDAPIMLLMTEEEAHPDIRIANDRMLSLSRSDMRRRGLQYPDLVAAADIVVTKPGYGIISECIANDTAILYTTRADFREYEVVDRELPEVLRCRRISQSELLAGAWSTHIEALLDQPEPVRRVPVDGARAAAAAIVQLASA